MKKKRAIVHEILHTKYLFFLLLATGIAIICFVGIMPNNYHVNISSERSKSYNENWMLQDQGTMIELPYIVDVKAEDSVTIQKELTNVFESSAMSLSFLSSYQAIEIRINQEVLYTYCKDPDTYWNVYPPAWHVVRLSPDMIGKTLQITYTSKMDAYAGVLNSIEIGTKHANVTTFIEKNFVSILLCFAISIFGIFAVAMYLFIGNKIPDMNELIYLGICLISISLWGACETKTMQVLTSNVQFIMVLGSIMRMIFPLAFLLFFRERFSKQLRKYYDGWIKIISIYCVVSTIAKVANIQLHKMSLLLFFILVIIIFLFILASVFYLYKRNKTKKNGITLISTSILLLFIGIDSYQYMYLKLYLTNSKDSLFFTRIGVLLFVFTVGYATIYQMVEYYTESTKVSTYKALAQIDSLSGIYNRTHLAEVYPHIFKEAIRNKQPFSVIMIDIDNFKAYNDNYGHGAGDEVIKEIAQLCAKSVNRPLDTAIRYGGEEFLVLLPNTLLEAAEDVAEKIQYTLRADRIEHLHSNVETFITVSQGIYSAIPCTSDQMEEFINYADKALYQAKRNGKNQIVNYTGE